MGREEYILNAAKLLKLYTIKDIKILKNRAIWTVFLYCINIWKRCF